MTCVLTVIYYRFVIITAQNWYWCKVIYCLLAHGGNLGVLAGLGRSWVSFQQGFLKARKVEKKAERKTNSSGRPGLDLPRCLRVSAEC